MARHRDPAHTVAALDAAYTEACRRWPAPTLSVELENDPDRGRAQDRHYRYRLQVYRLQVYRLRLGRNGGKQYRQHASGFGPTPAMALANCRTWVVHRRRAAQAAR